MLRHAARPLLRHALAAVADAAACEAAAGAAPAAARQQQRLGAAAAGGALRRWMATEPTPAAKEAVERTIVVNTLDLAKRFEGAGLSREQAEQLSNHITTQVVLDRMRLSEKFVAKADLEKLVIEQDARVGSFKAELVQKQEAHLATLHKDLERQQNFLDKMRSETRHEIDKLTSSQRLDLNLEKGRMRDDLQHMRDKATELELKMDREVNDLRATVERAKNDIIKTVIGVLGTFSAVAFTISRMMTMS